MRLFSHISSYIYEIDIVLPLKYIRHISVSKLLLSFYSNYVRHNNIAPKAPTQKMLSAFQVFRKSPKLPLSFMKLQSISIFWLLQNHLIKSRFESFCLEVLWSILSKHSFVYANCYFSSNSSTWMWCNFKLWSLHSVREWNTHIDLALLRFRSQSLLNLAITSFMCQIMPLCVASFLITSWLFGMWNNYFIS